jgi:tetratricopeptide (TPR) repeat protein
VNHPHGGLTPILPEALRYSAQAALYNNRGNDYRGKGDLEKALADFAEAVRLAPKTALYRRNLGYVYRDMADFDKALTEYDEALRLEPKNAWNHVARGDLHYRRPDYDKAVADYTAALKLDPNYQNAYFQRGRTYSALLDYNKAVANYSEAIRIAPTAAAFNSRAYAYQKSGERTKAIEDYLESIKRDPTSVFATINYANLMIAEGKEKEAEVVFRAQVAAKKKLVMDNPLNPFFSTHRQDLAWAYENLASLLRESGRLSEAESTCAEALSLRRDLAKEHARERLYQVNLAGCLNKMGSILLRLNNAKKAPETFREDLAVREKILKDFASAESCNSLAWFLTVCPDPDFRDLKRGISLAQESLAKSPWVGNYHNTLGVAQYRSGQWKEAVASLETSMKLASGGTIDDWLFLAMAHKQLGDEKKARQWYDRAVTAMENDYVSEERRRFRDEAAILLKIAPKSP